MQVALLHAARGRGLRACAGVFMAIACVSPDVSRAQAQLSSPAVTSGILQRVWGDPVPGAAGGPRRHVEIVDPVSGRTITVDLPDAVAGELGGIDAMVGRSVTATLAPAAALGTPGNAGPPPTVTSIAVAQGLTTDPLPYAPSAGTQRWVVLPCRYVDNPSTPVSQSYLQTLVGEGPASMGEYWAEASYGKVRIVGEAMDWRTMARPHAAYFTDTNGDGVGDVNWNLLRDDCFDQSDAEIDFANVAGVLLVFNGDVGCCAWGGSSLLDRDGVTRSIGMAWLPAGFGTQHNVMGHEMGHAYGLGHLRDVGTTGLRWDVMASGATCSPTLPVGCRAVHISAPHKDQLGWIDPARRFVPPAGTTDTVMLESLAQPPSQGAYLAAVIPVGSEQLAVESRWRRGYDAGVPGDAVVIYRVDPSRGERTAVVDGDGNGDRNDAGAMWLPGETFTDAASGVTVRVDGVTELGHVVTITRPAVVPPSNTTCLTARDVTTLPVKETVSTEAISNEGDLPFSACAPMPARTLWYRLTAPADGQFWAYATNSSPAATVTMWMGSCDRPGSLWQSRCDGGSSAPSSFAAQTVTPGQVVYVAFTAGGASAGTIAVDISFQPRSSTSCATAVPSPLIVPAAGGTVTFTVSAAADCSWFLSDNVNWLAPVGSTSRTGPGTATFTVSPNSGPGRGHAMWLSGTYVPLMQDGCAVGDDDCDGLPTSWERAVGLDPLSAAGADGGAGDPDNDGLTNTQERAQQSHPRGTFTRYFAEGATGSFFNARLALANPGLQPVRTMLRFLTASGVATSLPLTVPAQQRVTVNPETLPGLASAEFATVVEADGLIVADRHMQWGGVGYGSHAETAITAPSRTWYLAEGSTVGPFALFYLLQNPSPTETTTVRVRYLLPGGVPLEKQYDVAPSSRFNIWVDEELFGTAGQALASTDVSAAIEVLTGPAIIVERAMYLTRAGETFGAGHESAGVVAPATTWLLAEGATGSYFDEFVLIANPSATPADVEVRYLLPDGTVHTVRHVVPAFARYNIWVDQETVPGFGQVLADTAVSVELRSPAVPIVVERAMWWPGTSDTWMEAHNSPGATAAGPRWALAEGEVGGPGETDTYVLIANVSASPADVRVTLLFEDGTPVSRDFAVVGRSRFNVSVRDEFPQAIGRRFGVVVESVGTTPAELVVERAMYSDALRVQWAAGTNALAVRLSP